MPASRPYMGVAAQRCTTPHPARCYKARLNTMANRTNTTATTAAAVVAATVAAPTVKQAQAANAHKYSTANGGRKMANAATLYTLTALGAATAAAGGAGKQGKATVMGTVAVAAAYVASKGKPLTGANIAAAMQTLPACKAAIGGSKAVVYAAGGAYCYAWLGGYIAGAARKAHGLLAS